MDYVTEFNLFTFNQANSMRQTRFEYYVEECIALAEGTNVVNKLNAIHEEEKKTIGGFFSKIWQFIKRIWDKFIDKMTRFISGNKKWLDKNRAIILNNEFKFESISIYNYPVGVKRMTQAAVPAFDYDKIKNNLTDDKTCYEFVAHEIGYAEYKYNKDDDSNFSTDMKEWFWGGAEQIEIPRAKVNLTDMFNYCYEYDKMKTAIEKDKTTIEKSIESMNKIVTNKVVNSPVDNSTSDTSSEANTSEKTDNNTNTEEQPPVSATTPLGDNKNKSSNESYVFSNVYGTYITEVDKAAVNGDPDNDRNKDSTVRKASTKTGVYGDKQATAKSNMSNVTKSDDNVDDRNKATANNADIAQSEEIQKACTRYNNAVTGVLSAKLSAAEQCYKDYMRILIAHVDSYIGRKQANDKLAVAASDYRSNDKPTNEAYNSLDDVSKNYCNWLENNGTKDYDWKDLGTNSAKINKLKDLAKSQDFLDRYQKEAKVDSAAIDTIKKNADNIDKYFDSMYNKAKAEETSGSK